MRVVDAGALTVWKEPLGQLGVEVPMYRRYPARSFNALPSAFFVGAVQLTLIEAASAAVARATRAAAPINVRQSRRKPPL